MQKFLSKWYPLLLILVPALFLRIYLLLNRGTFWFDENFSIHFSMLSSWSDTLKYWILETNPPFYMVLLKSYLPFINENNEILVRLPSLFFSIGSIILLYIFAQKIFSKRVAIVSSSLLAISTLNLLISVEARAYSLLTFLTILSFYLFYRLVFDNDLNQSKNNWLWVFYFLVNLLILYSHLTGAIVLLCQFICIVAVKPNREIFISWIKIHFLAISLYLFWFIPSIINKISLKLGSAWYFDTNGDILDLLSAPLFNNIVKDFLKTLFFIIFILLTYLLIKDIKTKPAKEKNVLILITLWALIPPILSSILGVFILKYITIAYPGLYLFYAYFLDKYIKDKKLFIIIFILIIILSLPQTYQLVSKPIFSWNSLTNYIEENESIESITIVPFMEVLSINKYYKGNRPIIGLYLYDDTLTLEERIVRYNWNSLETSDEHLKDWVFDKINNECAKKLFLIHPPQSFERLDKILIENNWALQEIIKSPGLSLNYLYIFNATNNFPTPQSCK